MTHDAIFAQLQTIFLELFELPAEKVVLTARLYEDLDLDSIDAVDMVLHLKDLTGQRIDPDSFKSVRTVQDIVNITYDMMHNSACST